MTDTELMFAVARGDENARAAIIDRHRPCVIRAAARRLNGDQEAAEDIADRVLARVFKFADQFDPEKAELGAWITWLTSRRATDEMRRRAAGILICNLPKRSKKCSRALGASGSFTNGLPWLCR